MFFIIRLVGITNPPLEGAHAWRQCTGLMVARNFVDHSSSIFYPEVNETNGQLGYVGIEFPALYYASAQVSKLVGYDHWYGRLINLLVSSIGVWFFYCLIKKYWGKTIAFNATLIFLCSIWFSFSRKTMSDTFCISLVLAALWYGLSYLESGKWWSLLLFALTANLGVLSKIPAGIYLVLFAYPIFSNKENILRKLLFVGVSILCVFSVYLWYFVWCHHLAELSGKWYNLGNTWSEGWNEITTHWSNVLRHFYFDAFKGYVFFVLFILGVFFSIKKRNMRTLYVLISVGLVFSIYAVKSGQYFQHHDYYIIPFVPVMALVAAEGLLFFSKKKIIVALLIIGMIEGVLNQQHDFFIKKEEAYKLTLEDTLNKLSSPHDLIAINGGGDPQLIYFSHRKGWSFDQAFAESDTPWEEYRSNGAKWLVFDKHLFEKQLSYPIAFENEDFLIYQLAY